MCILTSHQCYNDPHSPLLGFYLAYYFSLLIASIRYYVLLRWVVLCLRFKGEFFVCFFTFGIFELKGLSSINILNEMDGIFIRVISSQSISFVYQDLFFMSCDCWFGLGSLLVCLFLVVLVVVLALINIFYRKPTQFVLFIMLRPKCNF